jgi:two-component system, sensor histidine kinase and response regulator
MENTNKKHKVLIVDDEPINIFFLEGILSEEGFEVYTADNGMDALSKVAEFMPDVILLDIMMPVMSGIEVLEKLMASPEYCHIPVIMVTARTEAEDVQLVLNKGAVEYVKKPVIELEMLARLRTVLRLKEKEDKLREQLHSKEAFISMLSHDMRAPLLSVAGLAEMLLNDEGDDKHKKILATIINSSNFIIDYFNKLLNWSNLGAKELTLSKKWGRLMEIFSTTQVIFSLQMEEKKQKLVIDCDPELQIFVDVSYFQQVINNLLSNAIKYTPEAGSITISAQKEENAVMVKVRDTGIGMPEITPDELFKSSFHKSTRGTKGEKGTGVGLRICKIITEAHGFEIAYHSEAGKGTEFIITAPAADLAQ